MDDGEEKKPSKRWLLDWQSDMGAMISHQSYSSANLLQNCDLPPPLKVFSPLEMPAIAMHHSPPTRTSNKVNKWDDEAKPDGLNSSLMRALQLSQTRAREAEKMARVASTRNEELAALLLRDSTALYAHRQWVKLLEIEIALLEKRLVAEREEVRDCGDATGAAAWCWTLALWLGITGVGFAISRCLF